MDWKRTSLAALALGLGASTVSAEIRLDWWTLDSGGGRSEGASGIRLEGTVGQPDASVGTVADLLLVGGLWGGAAPDLLFKDGFEDEAPTSATAPEETTDEASN
jgi:hypothetical protein